MIVSITHKGLRKLWEDNDASLLPAAYVNKIRVILDMLNKNAPLTRIRSFKGYQLHSLSGDKKEYWSLKISGNYRIVFKLIGEGVYFVNFVDYH